jgi:type VI secretion system ImpM family protein
MGLGIYGKHPAKGDFLETGLPPALLQVLERWLDTVLAECRATLGGDWERVWDQAGPGRPVLRFWLGEDIWGQAICGVMAPSRDRVGRRFPLVMLYTDPDPAAVPPPPVVSTDQGWYDRAEAHLRARLEAPALDAVARLLDGVSLPDGLEEAPMPGTADFWAAGGDATALLADIVLTDHRRAAAGRSYWWLAADPVEDEVLPATAPEAPAAATAAVSPPPAELWVDDPFLSPQAPPATKMSDDTPEAIWGAPLPTPSLAATIHTDDPILTEEMPEDPPESAAEDQAEAPDEAPDAAPDAAEPPREDPDETDPETIEPEETDGGAAHGETEVEVTEDGEPEDEEVEDGDGEAEDGETGAGEDEPPAPEADEAVTSGDAPEDDPETLSAEEDAPDTREDGEDTAGAAPDDSNPAAPDGAATDPLDNDTAPPGPDAIVKPGDSLADWAADALLDASPIGGGPLESKAPPAPAANAWAGNAWLDPDIPEDDLPELAPLDAGGMNTGAAPPPPAAGPEPAPKPRGREVSQVHAGAGLPSGAVLAWFLRGM